MWLRITLGTGRCLASRQVEMANLSAEVAQQRPLWEKSKQLEKINEAEVAEVSDTAA